MTMIRSFLSMAGLSLLLLLAANSASASSCKTYGAKATAGSEKSAKWFVMETIVQQVSWGLWPGWVANGKTPGYKVRGKRFKCRKSAGGSTCIGQATFCRIK